MNSSIAEVKCTKAKRIRVKLALQRLRKTAEENGVDTFLLVERKKYLD